MTNIERLWVCISTFYICSSGRTDGLCVCRSGIAGVASSFVAHGDLIMQCNRAGVNAMPSRSTPRPRTKADNGTILAGIRANGRSAYAKHLSHSLVRQVRSSQKGTCALRSDGSAGCRARRVQWRIEERLQRGCAWMDHGIVRTGRCRGRAAEREGKEWRWEKDAAGGTGCIQSAGDSWQGVGIPCFYDTRLRSWVVTYRIGRGTLLQEGTY